MEGVPEGAVTVKLNQAEFVEPFLTRTRHEWLDVAVPKLGLIVIPVVPEREETVRLWNGSPVVTSSRSTVAVDMKFAPVTVKAWAEPVATGCGGLTELIEGVWACNEEPGRKCTARIAAPNSKNLK